jgi:hypothetical protein
MIPWLDVKTGKPFPCAVVPVALTDGTRTINAAVLTARTAYAAPALLGLSIRVDNCVVNGGLIDLLRRQT